MSEIGEEAVTEHERIMTRLQEFKESRVALHNAQYIHETYQGGQPAHMSEEEWQQWQEKFPQPDPEHLPRLETADQAEQATLAAELSIPEEHLPDLLEAFQAVQLKEGMAHAWWPGVCATFGQNTYDVYNGLVTLARLTGEDYKLHESDVDTPCYKITPATDYLVEKPGNPYLMPGN